MNVRPFTDKLRTRHGNAFKKMFDSRAGGVRVYQTAALFHLGFALDISQDSTWTAVPGDRWVEIQLWGDGSHRVSFMRVTKKGIVDLQGAPYMIGDTHPTDFSTPAEMLDAIQTQVNHD